MSDAIISEEIARAFSFHKGGLNISTDLQTLSWPHRGEDLEAGSIPIANIPLAVDYLIEAREVYAELIKMGVVNERTMLALMTRYKRITELLDLPVKLEFRKLEAAEEWEDAQKAQKDE